MTWIIWIGIVLCLSQSATLSGLNLACFRMSKLELKLEASQGSSDAARLLELRGDSNFLLVTILWGNVSVNVLLALLSGSVMAGVVAFLFSTVLITIVGEIIPQAYSSRHAVQVAARFAPVIRAYQALLFVVAKPTAMVLDRWLGREAIVYFQERDLRNLLRIHAQASETEIGRMEGIGALNFLELDDLPLSAEGEPVDPDSVIAIDFQEGRPVFPPITASPEDAFVQSVHASGQSWVVLADPSGEARMVLDADGFLRDVFFRGGEFDPDAHCHRPIIVSDPTTPLGHVVPRLRVYPDHSEDDVLEEDIILLWGPEARIVTGSDILGRLLRGVVRRKEPAVEAPVP